MKNHCQQKFINISLLDRCNSPHVKCCFTSRLCTTLDCRLTWCRFSDFSELYPQKEKKTQLRKTVRTRRNVIVWLVSELTLRKISVTIKNDCALITNSGFWFLILRFWVLICNIFSSELRPQSYLCLLSSHRAQSTPVIS